MHLPLYLKGKRIKKQTIGLILPFLICLSMPLVAAAELSIVVVHSPGSGDPGDWLTFIVEVREDGSPAADQTVTFSITSGDGNLSFLGGSSTSTTAANGRASKTLVLGNNASGSYTVTASVGTVSVSGTATVDTPPPPSPSPPTRTFYRVESTPFHPGDTVTFIASVRQVRDGADRGVSGETVTFSLSPNNGTASLSATSGTTDSNGSVRTTLTLSNKASGSYRVRATFGDGTTKTHSTGTVYNPNRPSGFIISMRYRSGSIKPGEIKTFTAKVEKDGSYVSGQTVTFSVTPDDGTVSLGTTSGTTNSNGRASTTLITGSNSSGSYRVTATLSNGQSISGTATVEISTPPPPSRTIVLSISNLGPLNPGDSVTFTALVREGGNRVSGQTVTFGVSPDDATTSLSTASATTDSNGNASTTLTLDSSASSGTYTVTATLDNGQSASNSTWIATERPPSPPGLSIVVVHSPGSGDPGDWLTFIVEVQEDGSPAAGQTVTFSITSGDGNLSFLGGKSTSTTSTNGRAAKTLVLGKNASGSYTVTASVGTVSVSRTATVDTPPPPPPPPPSPPTRTFYRVESTPFHPGDTVTFIASVRQVRDGADRGVSGETVTFSLSPNNGTASLSATSGTTDVNGSARTTLTLSSWASGSYRVRATFGDGTSKTHSTGTVYNPAIPPGFIMGMRYRVSPINPGESMTFTAEIEKDGSYVSGQAVTFSVTPDDGTVALSTTSGTTNSNGRASTTLSTGSNSSGSYRVTATLNNGQFISGTVTVGTPPPPRSLVIFLHHLGAVLPGGTVTFTAEVKEGGNSVQGQSVAFSVSPDDGTASLSTASTITDSVGQAQTMLVLGNDASGAYTITASINSLSVSSTVTVETVPIEPPTSQQQQLDLAIGSHLTPRGASVTVSVSQNGNPVADQTVRFSVTSDDGTALLSTTSTTTDSDGQASTTLSAGSGSAGPYKVTATLNNGQTSGTATVDTASPSPILEPTSLLIVSGDNQSGLISETLMTPFVVEVRDQYDAPLSEVAVTFVVLTGSGRLSNPTATTDANGQAASILRLGTETGINTVEVSVEGIPEIVTFSAVAELLEFDFSVPSGISLIHIPLRVRSVNGVAGAIESVADLYTVLGGAANVIYLVTRDTQTQEWIGYFGPSDTGTAADAELREDTGIVASLITSKELHLRGTPLGTNGNSTITLGPGINCVGIPLRDSRIMQVSDLFTLDGIAGNVSVIQLIINGEFKSFGPTDAAADNIPIIGGQSLILIASRPATVAISGAGWTNAAGTGAAPSVTMTSLHVDDVTPILALSGSIANEGNELNQTGFRVIVKNRSTGKTVTAVAKSEYLSHSFKWGSDVDLSPDLIGGIGYRLAVVDMETGRAAMIGDTLEISVQSPHPRISVEPLEYTVTTEDVRQGWIQLPALGAYEIPAETALLHNYPNPFNPETWIPYRLAEDAFVKLTIYNSSGQVVRTLDMGYQTAAVYESQSKAAYWDGRNNLAETVASGVYFYTLTAGDFSATRKMLILK